ncbi:MAG TPA: addiction module protein [Pyrinomonadaceae bacterium]|nr:addiction module protein [Pyrinomonadaceae bacterium]
MIAQIRSLSKEEKLRVLDALLTDLDLTASKIEAVWIEEARERWHAYKAGRLATVSYEELMSKYKH